MTSVEIFAVVIGLWFGYLLVSHFMGEKPKTQEPPAANREASDASARSDNTAHQQSHSWDFVLEVARSASVEEIRAAYRTQMSRYHPDKVASLGKDLKAVAEKKSKEINAAYEQAMRERGAAF